MKTTKIKYFYYIDYMENLFFFFIEWQGNNNNKN